MAAGNGAGEPAVLFPRPASDYRDEALGSVPARLVARVTAEPLNGVATLIFLAAILHTFLTPKFRRRSHRLQEACHALEAARATGVPVTNAERRYDRTLFAAQVFHFLGEVEAVFGVWLVPLGLAIILFKGWPTMVGYMGGANVAEPIFVVVIMAMAASLPVVRLAERVVERFARLGRGTPGAWWLTILTVGPLLGSFITEPAAMTISALLLRHHFFSLQPRRAFRYATLGALFVNVSVGGTLTHFAAPPVIIVARAWGWDLPYMATHFGWKAVVAIVVSNGVYYGLFRRELRALNPRSTSGAKAAEERRTVPAVVTAVHLLFIVWTVVNAHHAVLVIFGFLFFLAFAEATRRSQHPIVLRGPLLVGFFLAALVIHGGCQQWWLAPVLGSLSEWPLLLGATVLTSFNDNAAITYLASLVPNFSDGMKYAVMAGAVAGGGLTVIANAPNPAGQSILASRFGPEGISAAGLLAGSLLPTAIVIACFWFL